MLNFDLYSDQAVLVAPGARLGPDVRLDWDESGPMRIEIARAARADDDAPTLRVRGTDRQADDWFGIDIPLAPDADTITLVARNYPANRLYPRLHFQGAKGQPFHVNLPDLEAEDHFTPHRIALRDWCPDPAFWHSTDKMDRLTLLIPSSSWFVMEIAALTVHEAAHA